MTNLYGGECHTHTMKKVSYDPHVETSKAALIRPHDGQYKNKKKKFHDETFEFFLFANHFVLKIDGN